MSSWVSPTFQNILHLVKSMLVYEDITSWITHWYMILRVIIFFMSTFNFTNFLNTPPLLVIVILCDLLIFLESLSKLSYFPKYFFLSQKWGLPWWYKKLCTMSKMENKYYWFPWKPWAVYNNLDGASVGTISKKIHSSNPGLWVCC